MGNPEEERHITQEEHHTISSATDEVEEQIFGTLTEEKKVGDIYDYQSCGDKMPVKVEVIQINEKKKRIEVSRDLIHGLNPFRLDPDELI
jgi:hypothetical protein